jgi:Coenzyme PQQ synthesis protein D (PqqD)
MRAFKKKSKQPTIDRAAALKRIPVKSIQVNETRLRTGEVVISYPVSMRPFFAGLVKRFGGPEVQIQIKKLQLDELGTSVWDMINGKFSVRQLVERFAEVHRLEAREAEVSVAQFIRELGRRGLIGLR